MRKKKNGFGEKGASVRCFWMFARTKEIRMSQLKKKRDPDELADLDAASACGGVTVPYMIGISKDLMKFNPVFQMIMYVGKFSMKIKFFKNPMFFLHWVVARRLDPVMHTKHSVRTQDRGGEGKPWPASCALPSMLFQ
jgi:hypothetical protein